MNQKFRVSFSGGKDSTAMLFMLLEKNRPVDSVDFLDTGYEYPEVYQFLDRVDKRLSLYDKKINYVFLKPEWRFLKWFYAPWTKGKLKGEMRGYPQTTTPCYLSRQKGRTLDRLDKEAFRYIGIGYNEKHRVTNNPLLIYPLVDWKVTEDECISYLKEIDLYPKHNRFYNRNGCYWCPKQPIKSLRSLYIRHPKRWAQMKVWEAESPHGFHADRKLKELEARFIKEIESGKIDLDYYKD